MIYVSCWHNMIEFRHGDCLNWDANKFSGLMGYSKRSVKPWQRICSKCHHKNVRPSTVSKWMVLHSGDKWRLLHHPAQVISTRVRLSAPWTTCILRTSSTATWNRRISCWTETDTWKSRISASPRNSPTGTDYKTMIMIIIEERSIIVAGTFPNGVPPICFGTALGKDVCVVVCRALCPKGCAEQMVTWVNRLREGNVRSCKHTMPKLSLNCKQVVQRLP